MEKASKVMYSIANVFNWIIAILAVAGIVVSILTMTNIIKLEDAGQVGGLAVGTGSLVYSIILLLFAIVAIALVRIAKSKGSSKGWDILFIVIGVLEANVFYVLGGIFGVVARR